MSSPLPSSPASLSSAASWRALLVCRSLSSCLSAASPPLPAALPRLSTEYPLTACAVTLLLAALLLAWLLQDAREELTRTLRRRKAGGQLEATRSQPPPASPLQRTQPTQTEGHSAEAAGGDGGDSGGQQPRSNSPPLLGAQPQPYAATQHSNTHARHRTAQQQQQHEADRDRERERERDKDRGDRAHDRSERERERDREREQPRRRSRYEEEEDGSYAAGGGYSYYRGERDREERDRLGGRESHREKDVRRRVRDRDGHSSAHFGNGDGGGRPSLSPTQLNPSLSASYSASLPSPGHRHHQSFSSVHSHVPPSPSHASRYAADSSAYEPSVSSLPSASMLQSAHSFSQQLPSPSHAYSEQSGHTPRTAAPSPAVLVIAESDFLWTLARGCELVKYGHYGSPHVRWFQIEVVHGVCRLSWGERRAGSGGAQSAGSGMQPAVTLSKSVKLDDILDVRAGKATAVFKQSRNDKIATDEACCFSIITQKRTLDLQARDAQQRDEWVSGLKQTLADRQQQQGQRHSGSSGHTQQHKLTLAAMAVQQQQQAVQP